MKSQHDQLPVDFVAQLKEDCTAITEVIHLTHIQALMFFSGFFFLATAYITVMLSEQFKSSVRLIPFFF